MDLRSKRFRSILLVALWSSLPDLSLPAFTQAVAQTPPKPLTPPVPNPPIAGSPSADPAQEAAKKAFESLPDTDRIAIQDGLIWTGDYKGVPDGKFGKGTRDAIVAFAGRNKLPTDGTLDAKGRAALALAAKQAKDAVHFVVQTDEKTGARIGLPLKLLTKVKPGPNGTRYSANDDSFSLETSTRPATANSLQETFAATTADVPGRKLTYKVLRPEFFVITGDQGPNTFYMRMARGEHAGTMSLNGFTFTYPIAARLKLDSIAVAIANSYLPFPDTAAPAPISATGTSSGAGAGTADSKPALLASGVFIAPGLVLTSLPKACGAPLIGTKKAKITKQDDSSGLTLLASADAPGTILPLRANDPSTPAQIVVLSFTPRSPLHDELIGAAGDVHKVEATGAWRLLAAVQNPVAGSAILDRSGALAGLVPLGSKSGKTIAGVLPEASRDVIPVSKIAGFLAEARPKPTEHVDIHTTGEIVAMGRAAMVPIYCSP